MRWWRRWFAKPLPALRPGDLVRLAGGSDELFAVAQVLSAHGQPTYVSLEGMPTGLQYPRDALEFVARHVAFNDGGSVSAVGSMLPPTLRPEARLRAALTERVVVALEDHSPVDTVLDDGEELPYWKACSAGDCPVEGYRAHAAAIAVGVFVEWLRDTPSRES